jgi:hypothetical protein
MCSLQSTDMNAPDLATQVVNRVRAINFGAKEGRADRDDRLSDRLPAGGIKPVRGIGMRSKQEVCQNLQI